MSNIDGLGYHCGRNKMPCVAVGPVTGTTGIWDYWLIVFQINWVVTLADIAILHQATLNRETNKW